MKKLLYVLTGLCLLAGAFTCCEDSLKEPNNPENPNGGGGTGGGSSQKGMIEGVVTAKDTDKPVVSASVTLQPTNMQTETDSAGSFKLSDMEPGNYKLQVTCVGYSSYTSEEIKVAAGKTVRHNVKLEAVQSDLQILDIHGEVIEDLNIGNSTHGVFLLKNTGKAIVEWRISVEADWLTLGDKRSGSLQPGDVEIIEMTIVDLEKLEDGDNTTTVYVTSHDNSKQLKVTAILKMSLPTLNTLDATDVKRTSATLHGVLTDAGVPSYTERGFVYSLSSMPTLENTINKLSVSVTEDKSFQVMVRDLEEEKTYYVRAYAVNKAGVAYSENEINCDPHAILPVVSTSSVGVSIGDSISVTLRANVSNEGDPYYTERGFIYGRTKDLAVDNPMVEKRIVAGTGLGSYSVRAEGLTSGTTYYVRAYVKTEKHITYGEVERFTTDHPKFYTDSYGLMMLKYDVGGARYYQEALYMCAYARGIGGYNDWRLPTEQELRTMAVYGKSIGFASSSSLKYWSNHFCHTGVNQRPYYTLCYYSNSYWRCSCEGDGIIFDVKVRPVRTVKEND